MKFHLEEFFEEPPGKYRTKAEFINWMKQRTFDAHIAVINLCETLPFSTKTKVINYQLIKAASSTAANYRAACRARSGKEFFAKMSIVVEECDETEFWLLSLQALELGNQTTINTLIDEYTKILAICATARSKVNRS